MSADDTTGSPRVITRTQQGEKEKSTILQVPGGRLWPCWGPENDA